MLKAVPNQSPHPAAPEARENAFSRAVEAALDLPGQEAAARITQLYRADTQALRARIDGLAAEASEARAEGRRHFQMLTQLQVAAAHKLWEGAKLCSELSTYREMFDAVRHVADRAQGEPIPWEDVAAALAIEPLQPAYSPVVLAFLPSTQFRGASFLSQLGDVTFVFTFIGWALIDHGPGAYGIVEPMFLVEDRAMPRSVIEAERHVKLERYLPHIDHVAA